MMKKSGAKYRAFYMVKTMTHILILNMTHVPLYDTINYKLKGQYFKISERSSLFSDGK